MLTCAETPDAAAVRRPKPPQFSLAHLTVLGCAPPEATYIAARAGYEFVSYRTIYMGLPNEPNYALAHNPQMLRETRAALAETGVGAHDIELARVADGVDVATYRPALETAAELGVRHVISSVWTSDADFARDAFGQLCDLAAGYGIAVDLEFVTWSAVTCLEEAAGVIRGSGRSNCGLMIDTLHYDRSRANPADMDSLPRDWFHFAHFCDAPAEIPSSREELIHTAREARLDPGEGGIRLDAILNHLPVSVYSLEIPNLERVKELGYEEHARRCVAHARAYVAAHPSPAARTA